MVQQKSKLCIESKKNPVLLGESDAHWSGEQIDWESTTAFWSIFASTVVLSHCKWYSKKQSRFEAVKRSIMVWQLQRKKYSFDERYVICNIHNSSQHLLVKIIKALLSYQLTLSFTTDENT